MFFMLMVWLFFYLCNEVFGVIIFLILLVIVIVVVFGFSWFVMCLGVW